MLPKAGRPVLVRSAMKERQGWKFRPRRLKYQGSRQAPILDPPGGGFDKNTGLK